MEIDSTIVVSLLGLLGSAIGSLCGVLINTKLSNYRIEQLEKKVDKHNNVVERMYEVEKKLALIKDHQQEITERVENLEKDAHAALNN